jgi:Rrf2 family protein
MGVVQALAFGLVACRLKFNLSLPYISKILKELTKSGILKGERGAHGGYSLKQSPATISIANIIQALDEPFALTQCSSKKQGGHSADACDIVSGCYIQAPMMALNKKINNLLEETTLADLQSIATTG